MKKTFTVMTALTLLLVGKLAIVRAQEGGDQDKVQGAWILSAGENAGRKAPEGYTVMVTFDRGTFTWKAGDEEIRGTFSLDPAKSPREISLSSDGRKRAGIYRLEGDELKLCVGSGDERPADFATKVGTNDILLILKRKKP